MVVRLGREKGPWGSSFLQLEREMVAWMRMGGTPSLLEMLLHGRARELGKTGFGASGSLSEEDINFKATPEQRSQNGQDYFEDIAHAKAGEKGVPKMQLSLEGN